ncbi:MAG: glycine cleavage system protein H [Candidatus Glassbacteria bacterium]|nr:glycine cleavage system protein H [Candidatus Glassbacteria bacterium]
MIDRKRKEKNVHRLDNRCIWMQAGMITYKLCSLDFCCEDCELDRVLRGHNESAGQEESGLIFPAIKALTFEEIVGETGLLNLYDYSLIRLVYNSFPSILYSPEVQYLPSHLWIFRSKKNTIRIGLDDFIGRCLEPIEQIVFPIMKNYLKEKTAICRLFFGDWNICFHSPVSGRITAINRIALQENPNALQKDSHRKGWLVEIQPDRDKLPHSFVEGLENIKQWYNKVFLEIFQGISELIGQPGYNTGATIADGGRMVNHFRQAIGKENYIRLLKKILMHN